MMDLDINNQPIAPQILLAYKDGRTIGNLFYDEKSLNIKVELEDNYILTSEMSCDVYNLNTSFWDKITDFKLIYIPIEVPYIKTSGFWYEITVTIDDVDKTIKHVVGTLAQYAELNNVYNYEVEIRTENDMNRDDYVDTVFYNPDNPDASIIDRVLKDKAPHYSIYYVEDSLKNVKRTFEFNGDSVLECLKEIAEKVGCIIIFGESLNNNTSYCRSISFYEAKDYCPACGKRGDFTNGCTDPDCSHDQEIVPRYGEETGLFINKENLGEDINLSTNVEEVKNCYRLTAGDDDMTAAVINCNPSASRYVWHFTDTMKQDMSDNLRTAIDDYISLYNLCNISYEMLGVAESKVNNYNSYISSYGSYMAEETRLSTLSYPIVGYTDLIRAYYYATYLCDFLDMLMMPDSPATEDTTAQEQMGLFTLTSIGVRSLITITKTTAANEVREAVKLYVDTSRYGVTVSTTSLAVPTWTGTITLTSLADVEDTYTINKQLTFTDASEDYIKNQIDQLLKKHETNIVGIKTLLNASANDFTTEIGKYSLSYLSIIASTISSVLSILDDAGVTQSSDPDIYNEIYAPYSQKYSILNNEISVRETQVNNIKSLINDIKAQRIVINEALKLEDYLSEELWLELLSFRREGEIENNNYISEGLNDKELIDNAMEFYNKAREDIEKQAELQYTITASLKNLLLFMDDRISSFNVGDWIRIEVDENIYKLRMTSYEINYNDLTNIRTEFTNVKKFKNVVTEFNEYKRTVAQAKQKIDDTSKQMALLQSMPTVVSDNEVIVEGTGQTLDEFLEEEQINTTIAIDNASKEATYYLSADDSGVMVADMSGGTAYTPSTVPSGVKNTFIDNDSFDVRDGQTVLASFGATSRIGKSEEPHIDISNNEMEFSSAEGLGSRNSYFKVGVLWGEAAGYTGRAYYSLGERDITAGIGDGSVVQGTGNRAVYRDQLVLGRYARKGYIIKGHASVGTGYETITVDISNILSGTGFTDKNVKVKDRFGDTPTWSVSNGIVTITYQDEAEGEWAAEAYYYIYIGEYVLQIGNGKSNEPSDAFAVTWDGNIETAIDTNAASGTEDNALYTALSNLSWTDAIVSGMLGFKNIITKILTLLKSHDTKLGYGNDILEHGSGTYAQNNYVTESAYNGIVLYQQKGSRLGMLRVNLSISQNLPSKTNVVIGTLAVMPSFGILQTIPSNQASKSPVFFNIERTGTNAGKVVLHCYDTTPNTVGWYRAMIPVILPYAT